MKSSQLQQYLNKYRFNVYNISYRKKIISLCRGLPITAVISDFSKMVVQWSQNAYKH